MKFWGIMLPYVFAQQGEGGCSCFGTDDTCEGGAEQQSISCGSGQMLSPAPIVVCGKNDQQKCQPCGENSKPCDGKANGANITQTCGAVTRRTRRLERRKLGDTCDPLMSCKDTFTDHGAASGLFCNKASGGEECPCVWIGIYNATTQQGRRLSKGGEINEDCVKQWSKLCNGDAKDTKEAKCEDIKDKTTDVDTASGQTLARNPKIGKDFFDAVNAFFKATTKECKNRKKDETTCSDLITKVTAIKDTLGYRGILSKDNGLSYLVGVGAGGSDSDCYKEINKNWPGGLAHHGKPAFAFAFGVTSIFLAMFL